MLDDPVGRLPLVASGQSETSFATSTPDISIPHYWRVVARDPTGASTGAATWTFQPNAAPEVDAGPASSVRLPNPVALDGTVTDDGRPGSGLELSWEFLSGPGPVSFADPNTEDTTAEFSGPGDYVLRLMASDGALEDERSGQCATQRRCGRGPLSFPQNSTTLVATVDDGVPPGSPRSSAELDSPPLPIPRPRRQT